MLAMILFRYEKNFDCKISKHGWLHFVELLQPIPWCRVPKNTHTSMCSLRGKVGRGHLTVGGSSLPFVEPVQLSMVRDV